MPKEGNAKAVARKVIEQIQRGELPRVGKAMIEVGYSKSTANTKVKRVKENKAYIKEMKNFSDELDELIDISKEIVKKKKSKASFRDGIEGIDKLKKLQRLVNGESTENQSINIAGILDNLEKGVTVVEDGKA